MATIPADTRLASRGATTSRVRAVVKALREAPLAAVVILGGLILVAVLADLIAPYDPKLPVKGAKVFDPPLWTEGGSTHVMLGTDVKVLEIRRKLNDGTHVSLIVRLMGEVVSGAHGRC